jgi:hypothetical protein
LRIEVEVLHADAGRATQWIRGINDDIGGDVALAAARNSDRLPTGFAVAA